MALRVGVWESLPYTHTHATEGEGGRMKSEGGSSRCEVSQPHRSA